MKPAAQTLRFSAGQAEAAVRTLELLVGWAPRARWLPVHLSFPEVGREPETYWFEACTRGSGRRLAAFIRRQDEHQDVEFALGLPEHKKGFGEPLVGTVLVVRVEGKKAVERATWLRHARPTMALREGGSTRRTLIWALDHEADYVELEDASRKLAYFIGAKQVDARPDRVRIPAPGTFLRVDRARPVPIVVSRMEPQWFTLQQVVGRLKEPPARDAWRSQAGGGAG